MELVSDAMTESGSQHVTQYDEICASLSALADTFAG
jgi:hypothetical protein